MECMVNGRMKPATRFLISTHFASAVSVDTPQHGQHLMRSPKSTCKNDAGVHIC